MLWEKFCGLGLQTATGCRCEFTEVRLMPDFWHRGWFRGIWQRIWFLSVFFGKVHYVEINWIFGEAVHFVEFRGGKSNFLRSGSKIPPLCVHSSSHSLLYSHRLNSEIGVRNPEMRAQQSFREGRGISDKIFQQKCNKIFWQRCNEIFNKEWDFRKG